MIIVLIKKSYKPPLISSQGSCICENTSSPSIMSRKVEVIKENEITFTLCDNSQSIRLIRQD